MKLKKGKSMCFFSAKGGVGKTTNIINLACIIEQLEKKYTDRVVSRILGNYTVFHFQGNDLRIPTWE